MSRFQASAPAGRKYGSPAPDRQQRRLPVAEIGLELRIALHVGRVVEQQVQLDLGIARPGYLQPFQRVAVRGDQAGVGHSFQVLPLDRRRGGKAMQRGAVLGRRRRPVSPDRIPALRQAFFIGVAVLGNEGGDAVRMRARQAPAHRRAVVVHHQRIAVQLQLFGEPVHGPGDVVERIGVGVPCRRFREAEGRQVGRHDAIAVGQRRDHVAVHVRRGREPVQQQHGGRGGVARLAVEDLHVADLLMAIVDGAWGGVARHHGLLGNH